MTTSSDPKRMSFDGELNLVRDVLVVLLALNHSLLATHVQRLLSHQLHNVHITDQV